MNDSRNALLRAEQLTTVWGVKERMTRRIMGELQALGFKLESEIGGQRLCPPGLAEAVRVARNQKRDLAALRLDPSMARYLAPGQAADELDALAVLVYTAAEVSIIRETVGVAVNAMSTGISQLSYKPFAFANYGLCDPRATL